ncbi:MAG: pyruvate dehydrogenase complex dihydrolipoamide acetyltransferase [Alphaproteobacteria bacterium]|nr:pyruvate dehydrogenase complex dihydrolipoamide acetyltransferase [Alphaproteobacteria bacterium]
MPIKVLMPALSPTMTEGNLVKWNKAEGDRVKPGDVIAEIETDKATMEVEAADEGIMGRILVPAGTESVPVNQLIAILLEEGEDASALDVMTQAPSTPTAEAPAAAKVETASPVAAPSCQVSGDRVFITPLAKRIAQQNDVDVSGIHGSGPHGRIVKTDVEGAIAVPMVETRAQAPAPAVTQGGYTDIKLNNMRKVIAKRLTESKQTVPHFYLTIDCNLDVLMEVRQQLNNRPNAKQKISVNDFIVRACALALIEVPEANASWHDSFVRQYQTADVSVAVAVDGGLITPIVRSAETKTLSTISAEVKSLAERARAGKLAPEEFQGGNFSISNLGMYGIKNFSAIINAPQACILAVGAGEQRAVVKDGQIVIATVMTCTLSLDHRVIDGTVGSKFLAAFKSLIEDPLSLLA